MAVKILDAGGKLVLSSEQRGEVEAELARQVARGAKPVAGLQQVGAQWVAACTLPSRGGEVDATSTLQLADVARSDAKPVNPEPEFDDDCRVEEFGFKCIVTGPSRRAVELRLEHLKQFGGELVGAIEENSGSWVAVVDTGGSNKTYKY
jgi:hypothetical protein